MAPLVGLDLHFRPGMDENRCVAAVEAGGKQQSPGLLHSDGLSSNKEENRNNKCCSGYLVSLVHFRYRVSDSKDDDKNLKKPNISFASFDNLFSLPELEHSRIGSENFFYIHYIIFFIF